MDELQIPTVEQLKNKREIDNLSLDPVPRSWTVMAQGMMDGAPDKYLQILESLSRGDSITKVTKELKVNKEIVRGIRDRHPNHILDVQGRSIKANLQETIHRMSEVMVEKVDDIPPGKMGYNFGAILDRYLLMEGQATSRIEHIKVSSPDDLKRMYEQLPE